MTSWKPVTRSRFLASYGVMVVLPQNLHPESQVFELIAFAVVEADHSDILGHPGKMSIEIALFDSALGKQQPLTKPKSGSVFSVFSVSSVSSVVVNFSTTEFTDDTDHSSYQP